jgi:hypothetical protein
LSIGEIDLEVVSMSDGANIQALEQFAGHPFQNWMFKTHIQMIVVFQHTCLLQGQLCWHMYSAAPQK